MVAYDDVIKLVGILTTMREPFNHHGSNVAVLAIELAAALKLPPAHVHLVGVGAHLHDAGKLLIRGDVLNASRKLTKAERAEVETHATLGWQVVRELGCEDAVCEVVRHHHERWDGKGYPDGLSGLQIPIAARVVGVCDAYSALISDRPYRPGYDRAVAKAMIQKDMGTVFEPALVNLFFSKVVHL